MRNSCKTNLIRERFTPIASSIALAFSLHGAGAFAATHPVTNCNDSGAGSLRNVINAMTTNTNDTVSMVGIGCDSITLVTGIAINQDNLTLVGPGNLMIIADNSAGKHRIFRHVGTGTLSISNLQMFYGYASANNAQSPGTGGCILSNGSVTLDNVDVVRCTATAPDIASGGGVFAKKNISATNSIISQNKVIGTDDSPGIGGGLWAYGNLVLNSTTVSANTAQGNRYSQSGGARGEVGATITSSTISGNHSDGSDGGLTVFGKGGPPALAKLVNSTISGNTSDFKSAGVGSSANMLVQNSTIAFNHAGYGFALDSSGAGAGLSFTSTVLSSVQLQSTLISNNTIGSFNEEADFSAHGPSGHAPAVTGSDNLILYSLTPPPAMTLSGACPLLGPLTDNGGRTETHAIYSHSPALNAGNNAANLGNDQRGTGFARVVTGRADIGAYEVGSNEIFSTGFDGCPIIPL